MECPSAAGETGAPDEVLGVWITGVMRASRQALIRKRRTGSVPDRYIPAPFVLLGRGRENPGLAGGDAPGAPGHGGRVQDVRDRSRGKRGEGDAGLAQQRTALVAAGPGALAVRQRRARHGAERQLRMHFVERVPAGFPVPVGLEQLRPQAPGLDAEALAGQRAAALAGGLVVFLFPDRTG